MLKSYSKGHSQLWDRADLDTSFLTLKKGHPNLESKFMNKSAPILRSVLFDFQSFTKKLFLSVVLVILLFLSREKHARLCCMQISYEMVSNAHVPQLTLILFPQAP